MGIGLSFVLECISFGVKEYNYKGEYVRCGVAAFNERAGFEPFRTCQAEIENENLEII